MPYSMHFHPDHDVLVVRFAGRVDGVDIADSFTAMLDDPAWHPGMKRLWDARHLRALVIDLPDVERLMALVELHADRIGTGRVAIVVAREEHELGATMLSVKARGLNPSVLRVFTHLESALAWLDVPEALAYRETG